MLCQLENIYKTVGGRSILAGLSLDINAGTVIGITGSNGCGKTTLLDVVCGLTPCDPGSIRLHGVDITGFSPYKRARAGIARTFQQPSSFENLTPYENLLAAFPSSFSGSFTGLFLSPFRAAREYSKIRSQADALEDEWLKKFPDIRAGSLSFGQSRLLEIIRSQCTQAKLYIFDEPLSSLDSSTFSAVCELVLKLRRDGRSVIIVEHEGETIDRLADKRYVLENGKLSDDGG